MLILVLILEKVVKSYVTKKTQEVKKIKGEDTRENEKNDLEISAESVSESDHQSSYNQNNRSDIVK